MNRCGLSDDDRRGKDSIVPIMAGRKVMLFPEPEAPNHPSVLSSAVKSKSKVKPGFSLLTIISRDAGDRF